MKFKYFIEIATGAQADTPNADWHFSEFCFTLKDARQAMAKMFGEKSAADDRGEEYEREWDDCARQAKSADVGDVISFDEFAVRICKESDGE